jgi:hypothetical protein
MVGRALKSKYPGLALMVGGLGYSAVSNDWKPATVYVAGSIYALASLWFENWSFKEAAKPNLRLVFRPELGDPYVVDKRIDDTYVMRRYRIGIANTSTTSVENVAVLVKSFSPNEKEVRLFHELRRMGDEPETRGSRFRVTANSSEPPRVYVELFAQQINTRTKRAGLPEMELARGEYSTPLWDHAKTKTYRLSLELDGDGAGPFIGLIYECDDDGVYSLRLNQFAKQ